MDVHDIFLASEIAADEAKKELQCVNIKQIQYDESKSIAEQLSGGRSDEN